MIESISGRSSFKVWSLEPQKAISVSTHHDDLQSFAQIVISIPDRCKGLTFDRPHDQRTNAYKSVRCFRWTSLTISYTRSATYTTVRGSRLTSITISYTRSAAFKSVRGTWLMFLSISYTFYTRITAYKKQGAPDRRCIQLLLLSACASSYTKSSGLRIDTSYNFY
jgi:hypothetical protein